MILLPKHRPPTSPGRLLQRFLDDHELTQTRLAELGDMQLRRVNEILKVKRAITPDTALRLARLFDTTPDLWLNAQTAWELWHAREQSGPQIEERVTPLVERKVHASQRGHPRARQVRKRREAAGG